tara:strand:+ start:90 stop:560 length:471 start_codon:yes stop_codon:yes gene_type:complete
MSFSIVLIYGCAGKSDISNLELASNINQRCFLTTAAIDIYYFDKGFNKKYEMLSPNAPWCSNDIFMESCQKVFTIPKSDEIKITRIFDKLYGTSGHCWEIFAKSKSEPDTEFSLPTCWIDHNPDVWIKPKYPWQQKTSQEPLRIDTEFLEGVPCSF